MQTLWFKALLTTLSVLTFSASAHANVFEWFNFIWAPRARSATLVQPAEPTSAPVEEQKTGPVTVAFDVAFFLAAHTYKDEDLSDLPASKGITAETTAMDMVFGVEYWWYEGNVYWSLFGPKATELMQTIHFMEGKFAADSVLGKEMALIEAPLVAGVASANQVQHDIPEDHTEWREAIYAAVLTLEKYMQGDLTVRTSFEIPPSPFRNSTAESAADVSDGAFRPGIRTEVY